MADFIMDLLPPFAVAYAQANAYTARWHFPETALVLQPPNNLESVSTSRSKARRSRAGIVGLCQTAATQHWAAWLAPAGQAHKPSSAALPVCDVGRNAAPPRCLQTGALHLTACGLADPNLSGGWSTSIATERSLRVPHSIHARHRFQQCPGVGMGGSRQNLLGGALLHDLA